MKKFAHQIIITIVICIFVVVGILVTASLVNSKLTSVEQAEKNLNYICKSYAKEFDTMLSDSEMLVKNLSEVISHDYVVSEYKDDRVLFETMKKDTTSLVNEMIKFSEYPIGLYFTFDPISSGGKDEIWFTKDEKGDISYIDSVPISKGWLVEEDSTTEYYFRTIREGSYWSDATYDPGMKGEVITFAIAVYDKNNDLIGVCGADILVDDIFLSLENIDKEIQGISSFIDKEHGIVAGRDIDKIEGKKEYIFASENIGPRWQISLAQPVNVAVDPILKMQGTIVTLGVIIIVALITFLYFFSRRKINPFIKTAEMKDVMMINQARQAKTGEMVGNIAHQWKQPLNSMKMSLSNMYEDYEQGLLNEADFKNYIDKMKQMINMLAETVDDFTDFLRPSREKENFSVMQEIETVLHLMDERIRLHGITVAVYGDDVKINGYRNEFSQCLFNLIDNARDVLLELPLNERQLSISTKAEADCNVITVFNRGSSIDVDDKGKVFELYYTTKEKSEGTGIGLYLTKEIIENHFDGSVDFENRNGGVAFEIRIPFTEGVVEANE